ncbi:MAG: right-handed parallel beta-helix repeat-containing protein [Pirellula sp.]
MLTTSNAQGFVASMFPNLNAPTSQSEIVEKNIINVLGTTKMDAFSDIDLVTVEGVGGNDRAFADGNVFSLSVVPVNLDAVKTEFADSDNDVNIANTAKLSAGVASTSVVQIVPTVFDGSPHIIGGQQVAIGSQLSIGAKAALSIPTNMDYHYAAMDLEGVNIDFYTGFVVKAIANSAPGAIAGRYYQFKPQTTEGPQSIVLHQENYADSSRWRDLGVLSPSQINDIEGLGLLIYDSNTLESYAAQLVGKFAVVKQVDMESAKLVYRNIGNLLFEQRQQLLTWISEHSGEPEAIARYQVQLEEVENLMKELGLAEVLTSSNPPGQQTLTFNKELDTLFVEVPSIVSSPGSIFIEATPSNGQPPVSLNVKYQPLILSKVLNARAGSNIDLYNKSPFAMVTNGILIDDNLRVTVDDSGNYVVLDPGNIYVNTNPLTSISDNSDSVITVTQDSLGTIAQFGLANLPMTLPNIDQDLYVNGNITNEAGSIDITNVEGSIFVNGEIRGSEVNIYAARDFNLNTEGWQHTNQDPQQYIDYNAYRAQLFDAAEALRSVTGNDEWTNLLTPSLPYTDADDVTDGDKTLTEAIAQDASKILAQGDITITARFLNVNGLIQSGSDYIEFSVDSDFAPPATTTNFTDDQGKNTLPGVSFGTAGVPIDGYWDATRQAFVLEEIAPEGGKIRLAGQVLSTGNGRLQVANGFPSVNIDNNSPFLVISEGIDTSTPREGFIEITDTATLKRAQYKFNSVTNKIVETRFDGTEAPSDIIGDGIDNDGNGTIDDGKIGGITYAQSGAPIEHAFNADIEYATREGLHYMWTEGQRFTQQTVTEYIKDDSWYTDLLFFVEFNSSNIVSQKSLALDEQPLVDSETLEQEEAFVNPGVDSNLPAYAEGTAYSIKYHRNGDPRVQLFSNETLVHYPSVVIDLSVFPPSVTYSQPPKIYRYIGADSQFVILGEQDYSNTDIWEETDIDASTFEPDNDKLFYSSYRNYKYTEDGPHKLNDERYRLVSIKEEGKKDFYTHSLKADYPIQILFSKSPANPNITVDSKGGILFVGDVHSPAGGTINLTSFGESIKTDGSVAIYGASPQVIATKDVELNVEGNKGSIHVLAGGDIQLNAISLDNASSILVVDGVLSTGGDVQIIAKDGIYNKNSNSKVKGDLVELYAESGDIGTNASPLRVESNYLGEGGLTAFADEDIHILQTAGDILLIRPLDYTDAASVESATGDVTLIATDGSILDADNEFKKKTSSPRSSFTTKFLNAGILTGTWSPNSVKYPVGAGLMKFLYPHTNFLGQNPPTELTERVNVRGETITLSATAVGKEIGHVGDAIIINDPKNFSALSEEQQSILANANATDVVGVAYGLYKFLGSDQSNVDLKLENFSNAARWLKLDTHFATGLLRTGENSKLLKAGDRVRVENDVDHYGVYEYIGPTTTLNLLTINYLDKTNWIKVAGATATDGGPANMTAGMIITNKYVVDSLVIRPIQDVNVDAAEYIRSTANYRTALESDADLRLQRAESGDDMFLRSRVHVIDIDERTVDAAIASAGEVVVSALGDMRNDLSDNAFRTQIAQSGSLRVLASGEVYVKQVGVDTALNGQPVFINSLFVDRIDAGGPAKLAVDEGNMLVNYVTSLTSVDLRAQNAILDAFPDYKGIYTNVFTPANAVDGDVYLEANSIGINSAPLTLDVRHGQVTSQTISHQYLEAVTTMTAKSLVSDSGNIILTAHESVLVESIKALNGNVTINAIGSIKDFDNDRDADIEAISITLNSSAGSIGELGNDLEIDTTGSPTSLLSAIAHHDVHVTEKTGRLVIQYAQSTGVGSVNVSNAEHLSSGQDLIAVPGSVINSANGDVFLYGADNVTLNGSLSAKNVYVQADTRSADSLGSVVSVNGTVTADYAEINTGDEADTVVIAATVLAGFAIRVGKGDDDVTAGSGNDQIYGGGGKDRLRGGDGDDYLDAGLGIGDALYGQNGNDTILGSPEGSETDPNFLDAIPFGDYIEGGIGNDTIRALGGADYILGGTGDDWIDAGDGSDLVRGDAGNDTVFAGGGLADEINGDADNDTIYGSDVGSDILRGGIGSDRIYGQSGNDFIDAGDGDDFVDAGAGTDNVLGGIGNDELYAGGGMADVIHGNDGDDFISGSVDGSDMLYGDAGRDRLYGNAGNDYLAGGTGDDILEGGSGDDVLSGDAGTDVLVGGANHDTLYALNSTNTGADNSVDYLYGDFGTNGNEPDFGRDQLYGDGGRDLLYGEADDDLIDDDVSVAGIPLPSASLDLIDYGTGDSPNPTTFSNPLPTANPFVNPASPAILPQRADYPTGVNDLGRWGELSASASGLGLGRSGVFSQPAIASTSNGAVVAWSEAYAGRSRIFAAQHNGNAWQELPAPLGSGVSPSASRSSNPSIIVTNAGITTVAWTERSAIGSEIQLAQYDSNANGGLGGWVALGNSLSATGLSNTGTADNAQVIETSFGLIVVWQEDVAGVTQVFARVFDGSAWTTIGTGSDFGGGISNAGLGADVRDVTVATRPGRIAVAWSHREIGSVDRQIYLREYSGTTWNEINGSATATGVSTAVVGNVPGAVSTNTQSSAAYVGTDLFVAWHSYSDQTGVVAVAKYANSSGLPTLVSTSLTQDRSARPRIVSNGNTMQLVWMDGATQLFAKRWNGSTMVEDVPGEASGIGITAIGRQIDSLTASIDANGKAAVAWLDLSADKPSLMVRRNGIVNVGAVYQSSAAGTSIQQILNTQSLTAGDVIVVNGIMTGDVTVSAADAGVTIVGAPGSQIVGNVNILANGVGLQRVTVSGNVTATNVIAFLLRDSSIAGRIIVHGGADSQLINNQLTSANAGIVLSGSTANTVVRNNTVESGSNGISLGDPTDVLTGGANNASIRNNTITGVTTGIRVRGASSGEIARNQVSASAAGFDLDASFNGFVRQNTFRNAVVGVRYEFAALFSDNDITGNQTGMLVTVNSTVDGLGFQPGTLPNRIRGNVIGVDLTGRMQNQRITGNTVGVIGSGQLVSNNLEMANVIESNTTGVDFAGRIEYQRIGRNQTGIIASNSQTIAHSVLYRNTTSIDIVGKKNLVVVDNTFYTPIGTHVKLTNYAEQVEIQNNIFWTEDGYDIFVANDSTVGFYSDFNVLHTSGNGKIGFWTKDFNDILDWQEDIAQFDMNSIGRTAINPLWSEPRFVNRANDDYRIFNQVARQRLTSPSIDAGNPVIDVGRPGDVANLLSNPSFESGLSGWTSSPNAIIKTSNPVAFDGTNYAAGGTGSVTTLAQTINLLSAGFTASQLDTEDLSLSFGGRVRSELESERDGGLISIQVLDSSSQVLATRQANSSRKTDRWEVIGDRMQLPLGSRFIKYEFAATKNTGATNDSYLDNAFVHVLSSTSVPDTGAYSMTTGDERQLAHLVLRSPDLYKDWVLDKPMLIRWDSFGNANHEVITIDLYQDSTTGPVLHSNIASNLADTGSYEWKPLDNGLNYGMHGLRIQVSYTNNPTVLSRSTETFSVPENTEDFYVNDGQTVSDEYTSAIGDNRNTGKHAGAPKPYPNNVLRTYTVGTGNSMYVDSGNYNLLYPLVISSNNGGDDSAFTLQGAMGGITSFTHANSLTNAPVLRLSDADLMTVTDVTLTGGTKGLLVADNSTGLNVSRVVASQNDEEGILIEAGSAATNIDQVTAITNGGNGIHIEGTVDTLTNSLINNNMATGLKLVNVGAAAIVNNTISNNTGVSSHGVEITNNQANATVFGSSVLLFGQGNRVFDNGANGIMATGNVLVGANTVFGHQSPNAVGILATGGSVVTDNVVHSNQHGIRSNASTVSKNRVYNNTGTGVSIEGSTAKENVVYSNSLGIQSKGSQIENNLIYDNTATGLSLEGTNISNVINNTIHQQNGIAMHMMDNNTSMRMRNNILWVDGGTGILTTPVAFAGATSDYNAFYLTNSANLANWAGSNIASVSAFQTITSTNLSSYATDPMLVNPLGVDGVLGYVSGALDGRDDDFHLLSTAGSFRGGSLAPVATNNGTGIPISNPGAWVSDAVLSVLVDAGSPGDVFSNEPAPNGNRINVGAYGNTSQASKSAATFVSLLSPNGGEAWITNHSYSILWTAHDLNTGLATYRIELLKGGVGVMLIANAAQDTGVFSWVVPTGLAAGNDYSVRIRRNDAMALNDNSNALFSIVLENNAPALNGIYNFPSIDEDITASSNPGTLVSTMLAGRVSDSDGPGVGIAISAADTTNGVWEYTTDGTNFAQIQPQLVGGKMLLLASNATTRIRFLPNANFFGNAGGVVYKAWDQADAFPAGSSVLPSVLIVNSLSLTTSAASIAVLPVNDPPTDTILDNSLVKEKLAVGTTVGKFLTTDIDSSEFTYSLVPGLGSADNSKFMIVGGELQLAQVMDFETQPVHSIRVKTSDNHGTGFEKIFNIQVENTPIKVTGLYVKGSGWSSNYLSMLQTNNLGTTFGGFRLKDGASQIANSSILAWQTINQIAVSFDEDAIINSSAIRLLNGNNVDLAFTAGGYVYDAATKTASWTLSNALQPGKFLISLGAGMIADGGSLNLDGEWTTSLDTYASSGDERAGGDLNFQFHYLPGDVTRNGLTNPSDVNLLRSFGTVFANASNYWMDVTANNIINPSDVNFVRSIGTILLPSATPTNPPAPRGGSPITSALGYRVNGSGTKPAPWTQSELEAIFEQSIGVWAEAGIDPRELDSLRATPIVVADFGASPYLGKSFADRIEIDDDAAGWGWNRHGDEASSMDLMTVILHELGHQLGLEDNHSENGVDSLMQWDLMPGTKRTPEHIASEPSTIGNAMAYSVDQVFGNKVRKERGAIDASLLEVVSELDDFGLDF